MDKITPLRITAKSTIILNRASPRLSCPRKRKSLLPIVVEAFVLIVDLLMKGFVKNLPSDEIGKDVFLVFGQIVGGNDHHDLRVGIPVGLKEIDGQFDSSGGKHRVSVTRERERDSSLSMTRETYVRPMFAPSMITSRRPLPLSFSLISRTSSLSLFDEEEEAVGERSDEPFFFAGLTSNSSRLACRGSDLFSKRQQTFLSSLSSRLETHGAPG